MKRLQWLTEAEIKRLEDLFERPSVEEEKTSTAAEELRAEVQRVREQRKRERP